MDNVFKAKFEEGQFEIVEHTVSADAPDGWLCIHELGDHGSWWYSPRNLRKHGYYSTRAECLTRAELAIQEYIRKGESREG
jgi:hypothetical protein